MKPWMAFAIAVPVLVGGSLALAGQLKEKPAKPRLPRMITPGAEPMAVPIEPGRIRVCFNGDGDNPSYHCLAFLRVRGVGADG